MMQQSFDGVPTRSSIRSVLERPAREVPLTIDDTCPRCGQPRDEMLVKLMNTLLKARARLAELGEDSLNLTPDL